MEWSTLTSCGICSVWGEGGADDATRFASTRPLPLQMPTAFVRIRPSSGARSRARLRCSDTPARRAVLIRVGSRGSRLALTQAEQARRAAARGRGSRSRSCPITTAGDRDRTKPFGEIGARGVFVKELEEALLAGRIDVAVHSAKDMTSTDADGLAVGAYPPREDPRDALCGAEGCGPACGSGPPPSAGARNSSHSSRRSRSSRCAATSTRACASAGAQPRRDRAGGVRPRSPRASSARSGCRFDPGELLPEAGQGALAFQVRAGEEELVARADDPDRRRVEAERHCVALVGGGCLAPVAAYHDGETLTALVADEEGAWIERRTGTDPEARCPRAARVRLVRIVVTRPRGQERELVARLEASATRSCTVRSSRSSRSATTPSTSPATTGSS